MLLIASVLITFNTIRLLFTLHEKRYPLCDLLVLETCLSEDLHVARDNGRTTCVLGGIIFYPIMLKLDRLLKHSLNLTY